MALSLVAQTLNPWTNQKRSRRVGVSSQVGHSSLQELGVFNPSQVAIATEAQHPTHAASNVAMVDIWAGAKTCLADGASPVLRREHCVCVIDGHAVVAPEMRALRSQRRSARRSFATAPALFTAGRESVELVCGNGEITAWFRLPAGWTQFFPRDTFGLLSYFVSALTSAVQLTGMAPRRDAKPIPRVNNELAQGFCYSTPGASLGHMEIIP